VAKITKFRHLELVAENYKILSTTVTHKQSSFRWPEPAPAGEEVVKVLPPLSWRSWLTPTCEGA